MRYWLFAATVACGTKTGSDSDSGTPPTDSGTTDSGTTTTEPDPRDAYACFADVVIEDGVTTGTGFDGYDADHPTWLMYVERDDNGNGLPDYFEYYTRDADGNPVHWERERGSPASYDRTYDERGNTLSYDYDDGADGDVDYHAIYAWDANDQILHYEVDDDGDGALEYWYEFTRTPEGYRETAIESADGDEIVDNFYTYFRDEQEREVRIEQRDALDVLVGVYDATYVDATSLSGSGTTDLGGDGTIDGYVEFTADAEGRRTSRSEDRTPYDAVFEKIEHWAYDAAGNQIEYILYDANDGDPFDYMLNEAFDGLGRQLSEDESIALQDGSFSSNVLTTWTFGGTCP